MTFQFIYDLIKKNVYSWFWHSYNFSSKSVHKRMNKKDFGIKVVLYDLGWPLRSYFILWKICVFILLTFLKSFSKIINKRNYNLLISSRWSFLLIPDHINKSMSYLFFYWIYEPFRQKDEICGFLMGSSTIYNTYLAKNVAQIILGLGFAALDLYYVIMARDEVGYCDIPLGKSFEV